MRFGTHADPELDDTDLQILGLLQDDCRTPLARIGEAVGLSAPAVLERLKKLGAAGVVLAYRALLHARRLGLDIAASIAALVTHPHPIAPCVRSIPALHD